MSTLPRRPVRRRVGAAPAAVGIGTGPRRLDPRPGALTREPAVVVAYVLVVVAGAIAAGAAVARVGPVRGADVALAGLLALGAAVHLEVARHLERAREVAADGRLYIDLKSMWSFAGLVLLPPGLTVLLVVATFGVWWLRVSQRPATYRWVFSAAAVVLASCAAWVVVDAFAVRDALHGAGGALGLAGVCLAVLVRWLVNWALVVGAVSLSAPLVPWRTRWGTPTDHALALGALALGVVVGVLADASPWLIPVLLVPLVTMHQGFLVPQLVRAAATDGKTGLSTPTHWRVVAERELARARRRRTGAGVLMIDLDEFKAVNDRHGHLTGDRALRAVADAVVAEVRGSDPVGRFGGEEFAVLVPGAGADALLAAAERIRRRVGELAVPPVGGGDRPVLTGLTVSVGAHHSPGAEDSLDDLLVAADAALYAAKRAGRNTVRRALGPA